MDLTKQILVIEDEPTSQTIITQSLASKYQLQIAPNLERAKERLRTQKPDLILLDFYLPDGDGFDMIQYLKNFETLSNIPIILLTQESGVKIKVRSFSEGVYDFITKPFEPTELIARIDSHLLRFTESNDIVQNLESVGDLVLDNQAQRISLKKGEDTKPLRLTPIEFKILQYLIHHSGKVRSREQLAMIVWKRKYFQSRTIDRHISSIRKKLGIYSSYLQTVSQGGYLLSHNLPEAL